MKNKAPMVLVLGMLATSAGAEWHLASDTEGSTPRTDAGEPTEAVTESATADGEDGNVVETVKISPAKSRSALVCRSERPIGSHIPRRVCRTKRQMDDEREDGVRQVRASQVMQTRIPDR